MNALEKGFWMFVVAGSLGGLLYLAHLGVQPALAQSRAAQSNMVTTDAAQTISGAKTFTSAIVVRGVASGQGALEIPTGARIWTDGATHSRGIADGFLLGDWAVNSNLAVTGSVAIGTYGQFTLAAIGTCSAPAEGRFRVDNLSGVATGKRTKLCLCTSDGSSNYAWQNVATGTIGNTTACGSE